jgi:hypothetical protein
MFDLMEYDVLGRLGIGFFRYVDRIWVSSKVEPPQGTGAGINVNANWLRNGHA